MPPNRTRMAAFALAGFAALLVGFHGASTLMTVTQIAASSEKPGLPKTHASLLPKPPIPREVSAPARSSLPHAEPAIERPAADYQAVTIVTPDARPQPERANAAAIAPMLAEPAEAPAVIEAPPPRRERPRRHRIVRPDLHRVY